MYRSSSQHLKNRMPFTLERMTDDCIYFITRDITFHKYPTNKLWKFTIHLSTGSRRSDRHIYYSRDQSPVSVWESRRTDHPGVIAYRCTPLSRIVLFWIIEQFVNVLSLPGNMLCLLKLKILSHRFQSLDARQLNVSLTPLSCQFFFFFWLSYSECVKFYFITLWLSNNPDLRMGLWNITGL